MTTQQPCSKQSKTRWISESTDDWKQLTDSPAKTGPGELFRSDAGEFAIAWKDTHHSNFIIEETFEKYSVHVPSTAYPDILRYEEMSANLRRDSCIEYDDLVETLAAYWLETGQLEPSTAEYDDGLIHFEFESSLDYELIEATHLARFRALKPLADQEQVVNDLVSEVKQSNEYSFHLHSPTVNLQSVTTD